jgi:hypothetical protein
MTSLRNAAASSAVNRRSAARQWRIGAAGNDQVHLRWQVVEQKGDPLMDRLLVNQVVVVEHQHKTLRDGARVPTWSCTVCTTAMK